MSDEPTITYKGVTDRDTLLNPTNHVYFNLNGDRAKDIKNHTINLSKRCYTKADENILPYSGNDIIKSNKIDVLIGNLINSDNPQFQQLNELNHPFLINGMPIVSAVKENGRNHYEIGRCSSHFHFR